MDNARTYGSRFSGLGLFLLALLVVGVLIFLTIRSASENESNQVVEESGIVLTEEPNTQNDKPDFVITNSTTDEESISVESDTTVSTGSTDTDVAYDNSVVDVTAIDRSNSESNLPNTGPESVIISLLVISALVASTVSFKQSRQMLLNANKKSY